MGNGRSRARADTEPLDAGPYMRQVKRRRHAAVAARLGPLAIGSGGERIHLHSV
jgi:hypothetical protein